MKKVLTFGFFVLLASICIAQDSDTLVLKKYENGTPQIVVFFKIESGLHKKVKEISYYPNGNLEYSMEVRDGVEHGRLEYYFEDGTMSSEGSYSMGLENGQFKRYFRDGRIAESSVYVMGVRKKHRVYQQRSDSAD